MLHNNANSRRIRAIQVSEQDHESFQLSRPGNFKKERCVKVGKDRRGSCRGKKLNLAQFRTSMARSFFTPIRQRLSDDLLAFRNIITSKAHS